MKNPSLLVAGTPREHEPALRATLTGVVPALEIAHSCEAAVQLCSDLTPTAVLLDTRSSVEAALLAASAIAAAGGRVGILAHAKDPDLILRCMRTGAREYALAGDEADLRRAVRALLSAHDPGAVGRVVSVFPAKGGVGATTIAVNLAGALARLGKRVCLVDIDRYFGDTLSFLDIAAKYSISDVIANVKRLDRDLLDASLSRHASGVYLLPHGEKVDEAERVHASDLDALFAFLRHHYDFLLVDGLRNLDEAALAALDASDRIFLILTPDVPAVRNAQRALELLRGIGHDEQKLRLVLNRSSSGGKVNADVINETTGLTISAAIANDYPVLSRAINAGQMLADAAPRSRLARDLAAMAELLSGPKERKSRGFFASLFGKKAVAHATR